VSWLTDGGEDRPTNCLVQPVTGVATLGSNLSFWCRSTKVVVGGWSVVPVLASSGPPGL
jgi:hypothetical protein